MRNDLPHQAWAAVAEHAEKLKQTSLSDLFDADESRASRFFLNAAGLGLDYSKNFYTQETASLIDQLCRDIDLKGHIQQMFEGAIVNETEQRAALHTLLRAQSSPGPTLDAEFDAVKATLGKIAKISQDIRDGQWCGSTGKPIRQIVHIGIGGSFLGPNMVDEALSSMRAKNDDIVCHYVANVDAHHITGILDRIDPEETLVIVVSKTFSTLETKANAMTARAWLSQSLTDITPHLLAVSTNIEAAVEFGVAQENILPMWDWVGGRYSLWSAVGVPIAIRYGFAAFSQLLQGAAEMDQHFLHAQPRENLPIILGFLGLLYQHCFDSHSHAVLTYDHRLRLLPDHLQQVDMESNGKAVTMSGASVDYPTGAIIWGGEGTNGQHAFHQLLHQGTRFTGIDFIMTLRPDHELQDHHDKLIASCLSQSQALMVGRSKEALQNEPSPLKQAHKVMPGNRPSNTIVLEQVTPASIGALIAMYEHKVFVQAMFWQINPFDQWGVELGKELGTNILAGINGGAVLVDPSTAHLLSIYKSARNPTD